MPKTEKIRKSPTESATMFGIGDIKKGNDGNTWKIIATSSGVHRWQKIMNTRSKTIKKSKRVDDKDIKKSGISTAELVKIGKKNKVLTSGASKGALALRIYNIRGSGLSTEDLEKNCGFTP